MGRICAAVATERLKRIDILSGQNIESVKLNQSPNRKPIAINPKNHL